MQEVKDKVLEHDFAIREMSKAVHELAETSKDSNIKLGEIAKSLSKQEVILEKLTNLEGNTKDSINRVHKRIDSLEDAIKEVKSRGESEGCTALKLLKEKDKVASTAMLAELDSIKERLYTADKHKWWLLTLILGAVATAMLDLIIK